MFLFQRRDSLNASSTASRRYGPRSILTTTRPNHRQFVSSPLLCAIIFAASAADTARATATERYQAVPATPKDNTVVNCSPCGWSNRYHQKGRFSTTDHTSTTLLFLRFGFPPLLIGLNLAPNDRHAALENVATGKPGGSLTLA